MANDAAAKNISPIRTATFSVANLAQSLHLRNIALFKPEQNNVGVHEATFNIYKDALNSEDMIGTYSPSSSNNSNTNWQYVKNLSTQTGAHLWLGHKAFLAAGGTGASVQSKFPGTEWVMYDIEHPVVDASDANNKLQQASNQIHAAELKFIPNLGHPVNDNESNVRKAAQVSEAIVIQVMGHQTSQTDFKNFVAKTVGWARSAAHPSTDIYISPSVSIRGQNDEFREPNHVYQLIQSLPPGQIDGVHIFYGHVTPTLNETRLSDLARLDQIMDLLYPRAGGGW